MNKRVSRAGLLTIRRAIRGSLSHLSPYDSLYLDGRATALPRRNAAELANPSRSAHLTESIVARMIGCKASCQNRSKKCDVIAISR